MNNELTQIAKRVNWFEPLEDTIRDINRFLVYFMQYCLASDIPIMRRHYFPKQFRHALESRPPGIMDKRSLAYWDLVLPK